MSFFPLGIVLSIVYRTHLKHPHGREWHANGAMTRRKAQGVAKATSSRFYYLFFDFKVDKSIKKVISRG